jgi:hypothetical protein
MCTLTIPTIRTINTMTKVVGTIKQWHGCLANKNPDTPDTTHITPKIHMHTMTLLLPTPSIFRHRRLLAVLTPPPPVLSRFFTNSNLRLASADPLRISPELRLVIFQKGNKGSGPVIGRLIAPYAAAFIFHRFTAAIGLFWWQWQWGWQWGCHWRCRWWWSGSGKGGGGGGGGGEDEDKGGGGGDGCGEVGDGGVAVEWWWR